MQRVPTIGSVDRDELVDLLKQRIGDLLVIKGRLPVQKAIVEEYRSRAGGGWLGINDALLQIVRDTLDMLVIDLWSLREALVRRGLFEELKRNLKRLRRADPDDPDLMNPVIYCGKQPSTEERVRWERPYRVRQAEARNEVFDRLFPNGTPVTEEHLTDLVWRFKKDTEPTDRDRNRVRAHRFERGFDESHRQSVADVEQQIMVFEKYLNELYLVIDKGWYCMDPVVYADPERTAKDLVELILRDGAPSS